MPKKDLLETHLDRNEEVTPNYVLDVMDSDIDIDFLLGEYKHFSRPSKSRYRRHKKYPRQQKAKINE